MRALFAGKAAFKQVVVERSELRAEALLIGLNSSHGCVSSGMPAVG